MKPNNRIQSLFLTLSAIAGTAVMAVPQAKAVAFQEQKVDQNDFAVVAVPFGYQEHRLEIIEQLPGEEKCWQETGNAPVEIDLLLLNFDHTNSCRRIINTNGYTLRIDGEDDRVARVVKIVRNGNELQLVAFHKDPTQPSVVIGRTNGLRDGAMKIVLNPDWKISKRVHQGQVINHLYLSGTSDVNTYTATSNTASTQANSAPVTPIQPNDIDTEALFKGVEQIYNNVVNPLLRDLSQGNNQPSQ